MTISERIFKRLSELSMTQKEFGEKAGIRQSTISEWKKKKTNPTSDKIMPICLTLDVTPEWLLTGAGPAGSRRDRKDYYVIGKGTELGSLVGMYVEMDDHARSRLLGYASAFAPVADWTAIPKLNDAGK